MARICYFGIYTPHFSRNRIYLKGLREAGHTVIECQDASPGLKKYFKLWKKHEALKNEYDFLIVGFPGHLVVALARLISKKPVVADLLGSLEDAEVHSHAAGLVRRLKSALIDRIAVLAADIVLLETEAQKKYFEEHFGPSSKYVVLYTGADDSWFTYRPQPNLPDRLVVFRGRLTPECGIETILEAAELLKNEPHLRFSIIGNGPRLEKANQIIARQNLKNVTVLGEYLTDERLRDTLGDSILSLGQFSDNERLSRTIPHKAFESFAMGIPYISADTVGIREIVKDGETGFLVPVENAAALADKIREVASQPALLEKVSKQERAAFESRFMPRLLGSRLVDLVLSKH